MIYIGFSTRSHKILARILCKKYRHCAPILIEKNNYILYQFIKYKKIVPIHLKNKDVNILKRFGWVFIKYKTKIIPEHISKTNAVTCVQFTKRILNIKNFTIQTPDALLKYLTHDK